MTMRRRAWLPAALVLLSLGGCAERPRAPVPPPTAPAAVRVPESVESRYRRVIAERERDLGPTHPDVAAGLHDLGRFLVARHRADEAAPLLEQALTIREGAWGLDDPRLLGNLYDLGGAYLDLARCLDAEALFRRAITIVDAHDGPDDVEAARGFNQLGVAVACQGDAADADRVYRRATKIAERGGEANSPLMADILQNRAALARQTGQEKQAAALEARAAALRHRLGIPDPSP